MTHKTLLLLLALQAAPLMAATEMTSDVPVDLARALIAQVPGQDVKLYSDMMDSFPLGSIPAGFAVVASVDQGYQLKVLLRASAGADRDTLQEALAADGWAPLPASTRGMSGAVQTGFVAAPVIEVPQMLCKSGAGMLQSGVVDAGGESLFQLSYSALPPGAMGPCEAGQADAMARRMNPAVLQQHMPRLELPSALTVRGTGLRPSGMTGGMNSFESSATANTTLSLTALFEHFAEQIEAQGWTPDTRAASNKVANGFWLKQPEADLDLVGVLTVIQRDAEQYDLQFRVQNLGETSSAAVIGVRAAP